jgi:hypothetical protein
VKGPSFPLSALAGSAHLHLDEPRAHAFSKGADDDKIDSWYLDTSATHHMIGWREFFSDLNSDVLGFVAHLPMSMWLSPIHPKDYDDDF